MAVTSTVIGCTSDDGGVPAPTSGTRSGGHTGGPTATETGSASDPGSAGTQPPTPKPTPTPTPTPPSDPAPITIAFAGDVHFEGTLRSRLDDPEQALAPIASTLAAADLTVVNLETSIGTSGRPQPKRYTFQAPPSALRALASAGVDVASLANNHGLDFGRGGLADTLDATADARAEQPPIDVVGIGADVEQAFAPAIRRVGGRTVAVFAASVPDDPTADPTAQWAATATSGGIAVALDPTRLVDAVRAVQDTADVVVVYLHWGVQGESCPSQSQTELAAALAAEGVDAVVGSHAHRLQGAGMLGQTYVAYGLGNFVWYTQSPATLATGVLTLTVGEDAVARESWTPARIGGNGLPTPASGTEAEQLAGDLADLRGCAGLSPLGTG